MRASDPRYGDWEHKAFLPYSLPDEMPALSNATIMACMEARAALAALDSTAKRLPYPALLRESALRREAQSTSALEGTYAPLQEVIVADEESAEESLEMREVLNYVIMANVGYEAQEQGRNLSRALLTDLQGILMRGTSLERESGRLRTTQVVIGRRSEVGDDAPPIVASRFVPVPPGDQLAAGVDSLLEWSGYDHSAAIDPLVKAGMAHYQFETLHPFRDGNGRLGRYLIVLNLLYLGLLSEPTLTVSPWFEARRGEYYEHLLRVSTDGDWDSYLRFFATGLAQAASSTHDQMLRLTDVQARLKTLIRDSPIRSQNAHGLVDLATASPAFTVKRAADYLSLTTAGAKNVINQLVDLGILAPLNPAATYRMRFFAPEVVRILLE
ncbi:Fic family protein [Kaistella montana]|nr:Fic family protein [Kaistella montana]